MMTLQMMRAVSRPAPGPGEVLVRVKASSVNPLDVKIRTGAAPHARTESPAILGIDFAGKVVSGGVGGSQGSLAEFTVVDATGGRAPACVHYGLGGAAVAGYR